MATGITAGAEVTEVVVFRLAPGVSREAFLEAARPTQVWLRTQPGMLGRTLLAPTGEDETWVDTARWASLEEAEAAMEAFAQEFADCDFERMIDPETVQMLHLQAVQVGEAIGAQAPRL